jgi:hypothetical protein
VEQVDAVRREPRVPEQVGRDGPERRAGRKRQLDERRLEVGEQPVQVAGRAGARLSERRRVDAYANRR